MKQKLTDLVLKLKKENQERSTTIDSGSLDAYGYTVAIHNYNTTLSFIKQLEKILND